MRVRACFVCACLCVCARVHTRPCAKLRTQGSTASSGGGGECEVRAGPGGQGTAGRPVLSQPQGLEQTLVRHGMRQRHHHATVLPHRLADDLVGHGAPGPAAAGYLGGGRGVSSVPGPAQPACPPPPPRLAPQHTTSAPLQVLPSRSLPPIWPVLSGAPRHGPGTPPAPPVPSSLPASRRKPSPRPGGSRESPGGSPRPPGLTLGPLQLGSAAPSPFHSHPVNPPPSPRPPSVMLPLSGPDMWSLWDGAPHHIQRQDTHERAQLCSRMHKDAVSGRAHCPGPADTGWTGHSPGEAPAVCRGGPPWQWLGETPQRQEGCRPFRKEEGLQSAQGRALGGAGGHSLRWQRPS